MTTNGRDRGSTSKAAACRVVEITWDRGHETFEAIIRAESDSGIVAAKIIDYALDGLVWVRHDELLDVDDLDEDDPGVRLADLRGWRSATVDARLTVVATLLEHLASTDELVLIQVARTGSDAAYVGHIVALDATTISLDEVDPDGRPASEVNQYGLDDIVCVAWTTSYLIGLTDLLAAECTPT